MHENVEIFAVCQVVNNKRHLKAILNELKLKSKADQKIYVGEGQQNLNKEDF